MRLEQAAGACVERRLRLGVVEIRPDGSLNAVTTYADFKQAGEETAMRSTLYRYYQRSH
jgi:hypothetical protein